MIQETRQETAIAGIKVIPAAGGAVASALTLNEWVALATLAYVVLQIGLLIPKYVKLFQEWRRK